MTRVGIIGGNLAPYFNESDANQIHNLSEDLNWKVITWSDSLGLFPFKKMPLYLIVNGAFFTSRIRILSILNKIIYLIFIKLYEKRFDVIFVTCGIGDKIFKFLNLKKCIHIITPISNAESRDIETYRKKIAPKLYALIARSSKIKTELAALNIDPEKIYVIYPQIDLEKFKYSEPRDLNVFRILFASAPTIENPKENNFENKGVSLMLVAFKEFCKYYNAELILIWRNKHLKDLFTKIKELKLEKSVKIYNGIVNMPRVYAQSHVAIIPYKNLIQSTEMPLSAIESLACGRPVLTSNIPEISELIRINKCGVVFKPEKNSFVTALLECRKNYKNYQKNCRNTAKCLFGENTAKYVRIYNHNL